MNIRSPWPQYAEVAMGSCVSNFFRDLLVALIQVTLFNICVIVSLIVYIGLVIHDLVSRVASSCKKKKASNHTTCRTHHNLKMMSSLPSRVAPLRINTQANMEVLGSLNRPLENHLSSRTYLMSQAPQNRTAPSGVSEYTAASPHKSLRPVRKPLNTTTGASLPGLTTEDIIPMKSLEFGDSDQSNTLRSIEWQKFKVPKELQLMQAGTASEISNIIKDSFIHACALHSSEHEKRRSISHPLILSCFGYSEIYDIRSNPWTLENDEKEEVSKERNNSTCSGTTLASESSFAISKCSAQSSSTSVDTNPASVSWKEALLVDANKIIPGTMGFPSSAFIESSPRSSSEQAKSHRSLFKKSYLRPKIVPTPEKKPLKECASCFDDISEANAVSLDCRHSYCRECFSRLVSTAVVNEHLFPPQCCMINIPEKAIIKNVESTALGAYRRAIEEYKVPAEDRWFCANPKCAKWFDAGKADKRNHNLKCPSCKTHMCRVCRGFSHKKQEDCPPNEELEATLETVHLQGWVRCRKCHAAIERKDGCLHITCRCRAQFW